ncbi:MAG TPA: alpha-glucan family phosphorylase [Nocardioides sp.]|uniref:alpha-glucan family phosphorylase n=1 Tax=Nocardioides sp. TaxID=35761 RepID=UPI002D802B93|nr:alpha-glucan family phosphorylase [Nocardioides sp.]HET6653875.1 alpha-glucan family phosphorylase [Nocardioides sp.]
MRAIRRFTVQPVLPPALAALGELAGNLRWSWHPETQDVFASVDPSAWDASGHDPVRLLGTVKQARLEELTRDEGFLARLGAAREDLQAYLTDDRWYQRQDAADLPRSIAYFSPEFGITAVLPQYSGGLGILAGDHLKTASDLGVPIVGVGLLYRHGYFRQFLSRDGWQQETYPVLDPDGLPIAPLRDEDGNVAKVSIGMPDSGTLTARVWVAQVGRVPLLLLDSDTEENTPELREVTDRLYGGNSEHRLRQEMLLGIGGVRAIRAYTQITGAPDPEVFHTNEGHAGFLGLERIRELTEQGTTRLGFDAALEVSRAGTVFTTHTPVPAGIDRFPRDLVAQYFGGDNACPGVPVERILSLGTEDYPGGDPAVFNMAVMGFRLAQRANGVSQLHGHVSRDMFGGLWPQFDVEERPIASITNGVHAPTWVAREIFDLVRSYGGRPGPDPDADRPSQVFELADKVTGADIWATKRVLRERLVQDARKRLAKSWKQRGAAPAELTWIDSALDPDVLTIGFARRVPSYKRLTLMLREPERLKRLLLHPERPIQLVIAGKSHPADEGGKKLIQEIVRFADDPEVRHRIVFLPNYDIAMAQPLYPGCDVWLNNPLRPYEACGTSGMKAALNGGLNLSILDGWWDEWYDGNNGWAIPSADGIDDPDRRDDIEATALYDLIEKEVAPRFYDHSSGDDEAVPYRWIEMVRHTLKSLGPKVLADRMVRDYVRTLYAPAAASSRTLNGDYAGAVALAEWKRSTRDAWGGVVIDHVESSGVADTPALNETLEVRAFVSLGSLGPDDVDVQVVHGRIGHDDELVETTAESLAHAETYEGGRHRFEGPVALSSTGPFGYTVRVLPKNPHLAGPAELGCVTLPRA